MEKRGEASRLRLHCWESCELVPLFYKAIQKYAREFAKLLMPSDPKFPLLGLYSKEINDIKKKLIRTKMFTVALSGTTKSWGKNMCPTPGEWLNKLCF